MKIENSPKFVRPGLIATGVVLILLSLVVLGMSVWEAFGGMGKKFQVVTLPGFHELNLEESGLYGGVYQHRVPGPMPIKALSQMEVRILYKQTYEEIPVLMNTTGQTFNRLGVQGMPVFNFVAHEPGIYTMSGIYPEGQKGPTVSLMIFSQAAQNIKQTLIVGSLFFALFLGLGILVLVKVNRWAPKPA